MTNHWIDLKNANVLLIMGSNAVENHPIASRWIWEAKEKNGATIIHVDPRFTRTSAKADIYAPIRSGTDIVFLGGMIRWAIENGKINQKYTADCTNALFRVRDDFETCRDTDHPGVFSGYNSATTPPSYTTTSWDYKYALDDPYTPAAPGSWTAGTVYALNALVSPSTPNNFRYECILAGTSGGPEPTWLPTVGSTVTDGGGVKWRCCPPNPPIKKALKATNLTDPDTVFSKLSEQYCVGTGTGPNSPYSPANVEKICGTPKELFEQICEAYIGGTYADDKAGVMLYAMGWTQHTVGTQNIRTATIVQSLLGNIGVAGGGVDALRGWHNVQGATDHGVLMQYLPGYLALPTFSATAPNDYAQLGVGPMDANPTYLKKQIPLAIDPEPTVAPASNFWWGHFANQYDRARYMVSLLKAWWPLIDHNTSYSYLPKRTGDCSYLSLFNAMSAGTIKGLFVWGSNPLVMGPDQTVERPAMNNLEWLVVCDCFEIETANFWKYNTDGTLRPDGGASQGTDVYLLPGAVYFEKKGSASNSGRLVQWRDQACNPPGNAKDEVEILKLLGDRLQTLYGGGGPNSAAITNLIWPCPPALIGVGETFVEGIAKEENGYALQTFNTPVIAGAVTSYTANQQLNSFFHLMSGGETACGNWLFTGTWQKTANARTTNFNQMKNRRPIDDHPAKIGIYRDWGYSWPVNRRIIYNRASVYQKDYDPLPTDPKRAGKPLNPTKPVVYWTGTNWEGGAGAGQANDVADGFGTSGPTAVLPYIMNREGVAKLMGLTSGSPLLDGPFPEHYEPWETPLNANPLTGTGPLRSPCVFDYGKLYADTPAERIAYPIVCTTYRLTEHWHGGGFTRNCPTQCELMPEPFVEISEELAAEKGISNGDPVDVSSVRGTITLKACVTKRFKPFTIGGNTIHQVGMPWHWGWAGISSGASANLITPFIGDVNTRIPETKVFLVNIALAT